MNPYEILGVKKNDPERVIKREYRRLAQIHHPDNVETGNEAKFEEIKLAYDILMDPARRKRFDEEGRVDEIKNISKAIQTFMEMTINATVDAFNPIGMEMDDPNLVNIHNMILKKMKDAQRDIHNNLVTTQRKIHRCNKLIRNFSLKVEGEVDYIGNALRKKLGGLNEEMNRHKDAQRLSEETIRIMEMYGYDVFIDPEPEGQHDSGSTSRRSGPLFLKAPGLLGTFGSSGT